MEPTTPPIGIFAKLLAWFRDFAAMPGRIRILAEGVKAANDRRPTCNYCGTGRIAMHRTESLKNGSQAFIGRCQSCGRDWYVNFSGTESRGPRGDHSPAS